MIEKQSTQTKTDVQYIDCTPNYEALAEWFALALTDHSFEKFTIDPVISLIEQIRFLTIKDPDAVERILINLRKKVTPHKPKNWD